MSLGANGTMLAECGMRVLAWAAVENQGSSDRRFRCVRGLALNAQLGRHWGER